MFNLLCFLECLHDNGVKHSQKANYLSAIKCKFLIFFLDVTCFNDHRLKYYQRAVQLHVPLQVKLKKIDVDQLKKIVCALTYMGQIFKAIYLLSFYLQCLVFICNATLTLEVTWYLSVWSELEKLKINLVIIYLRA